MVDISTELRTIQNEEGGEAVRSAIASALDKLKTSGVDITTELLTIQTGRYGIDIRMAIHDALYKLANSAPEQVGISIPVHLMNVRNGFSVFDVLNVTIEEVS